MLLFSIPFYDTCSPNKSQLLLRFDIWHLSKREVAEQIRASWINSNIFQKNGMYFHPDSAILILNLLNMLTRSFYEHK